MKTTFNVNKTTRAAIKFAALSVNRKSNVPILENIHCSANGSLEMTGTDLDVWTVSRCPCNSEIDGKVTLPCPALKDVAGVKIDGEIFFSSDEKNIVTISQSGNERRIYGLAADEFPAMPVLGKTRNVVLNGGKLIAALKAVSLAMSTDESRYVLNGVCFEVGAEIVRLIATDGRRLQMAEISRLGIDAEIEKTKGFIGKKNGKLAMAAGAKLIRLQTCLPFIIPAKAIELIQKFPLGKNPLGTEISMEFGETYARFTFGDFTLITKQIEENYPNYKQVIPIDFKERVTVSAKEFQNALEIAKKGTSEKARAVRLDIENNLLVASSNSPEVGATVAKMPVNYKGKPFCISFDPAYLIDACKSVSFIGADMVCDFTDELTPVKISSPDGVLQIVIMPIRMESGKPCVEKPVVSAPV